MNPFLPSKNQLSDQALSYIKYFFFLLLAIAYGSHLGYTPLNMYTDEARRALVAAEMMLSGDYITPTLNGEIYLNKPPLYNWIIVAYFKLSGGYSMFAFRLPVIVATFGMAITLYHFVKKYTNQFVAFFAATAFLTNGRIFFYDSLMGLIDTSFSWLVLLNFMLVYHFGEKKKYWQLFLITYLFTTMGFLMKGLPALLFQALTLLVYFIMKKDFKSLFRLSHFAGIFLFILLAGGYYLAYFSRNDVAPATLFTNMFTESSKRTAIKFGLKDTIWHLATFPFEMLYHFLPWTIFVLALLRRNLHGILKENRFIYYICWIFLVNIIPYWSSVEVFARYLLMFAPLIYTLFFYMYDIASPKVTWPRKWIDGIVTGLCIAVFLFSLTLPFLPDAKVVAHLYMRSAILIVLFGFAAWLCLRYPAARLYAFLLSVAILRIGFNWFIVESRAWQYFDTQKVAHEVIDITKNEDVYILRNAKVGNFDAMSFHISTAKGKVLKFRDDAATNVFYIADFKQLEDKQYEEFMQFTNYLSDSLKLVKFIH